MISSLTQGLRIFGVAVIGLLGVGVVVAIFLSFVLPNDDFCGESQIAESVAPGGKVKAVVFSRDCGATTEFNSHVALIPSDSSLSTESKSFLGVRAFFSADCNNGRAPAGTGGGPEVRIRWVSDTRIEIQHHNAVRIIQAASSSKGVVVDYLPFQ
jgi:hypothetical protein